MNGKQYIAITAGGTPTSSNGGSCCSELHVFALGGSQKESPPPDLPKSQFGEITSMPTVRTAPAPNIAPQRIAAPQRATAKRRVSLQTALGRAQIRTQPAIGVRPWLANSSNVQLMFGRVRLGSSPVVGATLRVDGYVLPSATGPEGGFSYQADVSIARRHAVKVVGLDSAKPVGGRFQ